MKKNILTKIISFLTVALFFLPLVLYGDSSYPFIGMKVVWLQVFSTLIFVFYLVLVLFYFKKYRPRFSWLGLAVLLFYVAIFLASIFGVDFRRSFWDRYERMTGLFTMLHYGVLFLVWRSVLDKEQWYRLWRWFAGIGSTVLFIGFFQVFDSNFLLNLGSSRVGSTLGNPIFVAGFCLFTLFSSLVFWFKTKSKFKWWWLAEIVLSVIVLFATQTRGDMLGLWAGLAFLAAALLMDKETRSKYKKITIAFASALVLIPLVFLILTRIPSVSSLPVIGRLSVSDADTNSRLAFWKMSVEGWKEKKWFGWGWENYFDMANKYYNPEIYKYGNEWVDNAHNVIFNNLATIGVVGSVAYLLVYVLIFYSLFKNFKQKDSDSRRTAILLASFFTAHFVQNLFVFENLASYLFFFWLLAGVDIGAMNVPALKIAAVNRENIFQKISNNKFVSFIGRAARSIFIFFMICAALILLDKYTYIPAKADYINTQAVKAAMVDFKSAMEIHRQAVAISANPHRPEIAYDFGNFILTWLDNNQDFPFTKYRSLAQDMYVFGVRALQSYLSDYPQDVRAGSALALAYQDGYVFWQNPGYLNMAEQEYETMLSYDPRRQGLLYGLAKVKMMQTKDDEAIKIAQSAIDEAPDVADSYWVIATIYSDKKDNEQAYSNAKKAISLGYTPNGQQLLSVFDLFKSHKDIGTIETMVKQELTKNSALNQPLLDDYINFLNSEQRYSEASVWGNYLK